MLLYYFSTFFSLFLIIWLGLTSVGRQFWLHRKYVEGLLIVFEKVKQKQIVYEKTHDINDEEEENENEDQHEGDFKLNLIPFKVKRQQTVIYLNLYFNFILISF